MGAALHVSGTSSMSTVGVTGGSGFLGSYCVQRLLADGHRVRTTVRSLQREGEIRALLDAAVDSGRGSRLAFFSADLEKEAGWAQAIGGCDFVMHVAGLEVELPDERVVRTLAYKNAVPLAERATVKRLVSEDNTDRKTLYAQIAKANGHPEWETDIRKTFARRWVEHGAKPGWHYQDAVGNWVKK